MEQKHKAITVYPVLIVIFVLLSVLVSVDYYYFTTRLKRTQTNDELNNHFASIRTSILELEYTLDMFIVARRFEDTTVSLIKRDVQRLDTLIGLVVNNPEYAKLAEKNTLLKEGFVAIADHWASISAEVAVMGDAINQEEALLIHNAVDVNTILIREVSDRLIGVVTTAKKNLAWQLESFIVLNILVLFAFWGMATILLYRKLVRPVKKASDTASRIASGELTARFDMLDGSFTRPLKVSLNAMLDSVAEEEHKRAGLIRACEGKFGSAVSQIEALGRLTAHAGRSLSRAEIYDTSMGGLMEHTGADAAAVYMFDDGVLRLKSSRGLPDVLLNEVASASEETYRDVAGSSAGKVYQDLKLHPDQAYSAALRSAGFNAVAMAPVVYSSSTKGVLVAMFREPAAMQESVPAFIMAVAANVGVFFGYIDLFHTEYSVKRFLERVFNQLPFGVAVFDKSGTCLFFNNNLKVILGAGADSELIGEYRVVEDDVLKGQGMVPSIQKSYEGYTTEFIINYDPSLVKRHRLKGALKRLKIRSIPLYDEGGEISSIALLYEDLSDTDGPDEKAERAV